MTQEREREAVLNGRFELLRLFEWHVRQLVVPGEHQVAKASWHVILLVGYSCMRGNEGFLPSGYIF